jgi:hypothetical protein
MDISLVTPCHASSLAGEAAGEKEERSPDDTVDSQTNEEERERMRPKLSSFRHCRLQKCREDPEENKITAHILQKCRKDLVTKQRT